MNEKLMKYSYNLIEGFAVIEFIEMRDKMFEVLEQHGYTKERVDKIVDFLIKEWKIDKKLDKEYFNKLFYVAIDKIVESFQYAEKIMEFANGYKELGEMNRQLANEGDVFEYEKYLDEANSKIQNQ